jgi:hypothetical protein
MACSFDTDCNPGRRAKESGLIYGVGICRILLDNSNDRQPVTVPLDCEQVGVFYFQVFVVHTAVSFTLTKLSKKEYNNVLSTVLSKGGSEFCYKCGTEIAEGIKICSNCGGVLNQASPKGEIPQDREVAAASLSESDKGQEDDQCLIRQKMMLENTDNENSQPEPTPIPAPVQSEYVRANC